jgi:hypothetical protein
MIFHDVVVLVVLCFFSSYKALEVCFYLALPPLHHIRIGSFVFAPVFPFLVYLDSDVVVLCEEGSFSNGLLFSVPRGRGL